MTVQTAVGSRTISPGLAKKKKRKETRVRHVMSVIKFARHAALIMYEAWVRKY